LHDGAGSRSDNWNSSTSAGTGADVTFIASRKSHVAREHVNSPLRSRFFSESLRPDDANITIGGLSLMLLKKLYGARFGVPSGPIVAIQPIGRGATSALNGS